MPYTAVRLARLSINEDQSLAGHCRDGTQPARPSLCQHAYVISANARVRDAHFQTPTSLFRTSGSRSNQSLRSVKFVGFGVASTRMSAAPTLLSELNAGRRRAKRIGALGQRFRSSAPSCSAACVRPHGRRRSALALRRTASVPPEQKRSVVPSGSFSVMPSSSTRCVATSAMLRIGGCSGSSPAGPVSAAQVAKPVRRVAGYSKTADASIAFPVDSDCRPGDSAPHAVHDRRHPFRFVAVRWPRQAGMTLLTRRPLPSDRRRMPSCL